MNALNHLDLYSPDDMQTMKLAYRAMLPGDNHVAEIIAFEF